MIAISKLQIIPEQEGIDRVDAVPQQRFAADEAIPHILHLVLIEELLRAFAEELFL